MQQVHAEGLGDIDVSTAVQAFYALLLRGLGRQDDEGDMHGVLVTLHLLGQLQTIGARHHDIGDDEVDGLFFQIGQTCLCVDGCQHAIAGKTVGEQVEHLLVVVDGEDGWRAITCHLGEWT